jgi:hypothetical protein
MEFLSASIYALLLLFALLGSFFVSPVEWGEGGNEIFSPLQASLRVLNGEGLKEVKLDGLDRVYPPEGFDRALVAVQQYNGGSAGAEARSLLDYDSV